MRLHGCFVKRPSFEPTKLLSFRMAAAKEKHIALLIISLTFYVNEFMDPDIERHLRTDKAKTKFRHDKTHRLVFILPQIHVRSRAHFYSHTNTCRHMHVNTHMRMRPLLLSVTHGIPHLPPITQRAARHQTNLYCQTTELLTDHTQSEV